MFLANKVPSNIISQLIFKKIRLMKKANKAELTMQDCLDTLGHLIIVYKYVPCTLLKSQKAEETEKRVTY